MKKSDELFKAALAAKADEVAHAKKRIEKMQAHSDGNKEALNKAHITAVNAINSRRTEQTGDLNRALDRANADADEHIRQVNAMFAQLIEQEDQRLADYSQFENEVVNGFGSGKKNSAEVQKLKGEGE